ncbi:MAG: histidinol-phosphatase [Gammaproteobacteria bacterium]|nr:histidinol-phosphatase [Gammaproteobacteria bacterium]
MTPASNDAARYLEFAMDVIEQAGAIALKYFRTELEVINKAKKREYDPVTRADREIEEYIRGRIRETFPNHAIIGEEFGYQSGGSPYSWLIDPIDGTKGFITGSPMWGVLLGLMEAEYCITGLLRQPFLGETYYGSPAGAFLLDHAGRTPLKTRDTRSMDEAIVCCTHPGMFLTEDARRGFDRAARSCAFTRFGTDCYGYALLARGFVDLVVEGDLEAYDIVPLIPIVEGAGGIVTDWQGGSANRGGTVVAAANRALHARTLELLNS